jgi:hypothetical protein
MLLAFKPCMNACTVDFAKGLCFHWFMKPDLRISIKDYRRNKTLKVVLVRTPWGTRQFFARMNNQRWPRDGRPVSLTRVVTGLRKALVKAAV